MAVQAFVTLGLIFSVLAQSAAVMLLVRWPLSTVFRYQWQILGLCTVLSGLKTFCLFLGVAVFGGQCWRRDWLLYPNFNYLSWSYAFAVIAMLIAGFATVNFYLVDLTLLFPYYKSMTQHYFSITGCQAYVDSQEGEHKSGRTDAISQWQPNVHLRTQASCPDSVHCFSI